MKLGAENKTELWAAIILGVVAIGTIAYTMGPSTKPVATAGPKTKTVAGAVLNPLDPTLRLDLLRSAEQQRYEGKGRNIFSQVEDIPQPSKAVIEANKNPVPTPPPQPPPPPPIPLKYFGLASRPGEPTKIFLSRGDNVFIAREGDIVDRRYRVVKVNPQSVEMEDLLNNNRQSIPLTAS